jgi:hypothetical protein
MVYGSLVVVLIVTLIFYLIDKKAYKWWEFFVPLIITVGLIIGAKAIIDHTSVKFTEYWGETIVSVFEEEPWNEWVHRTCTETYPCGTDSEGNTKYCTRTYDCSYQDDHGPRWYCKTDLGNTYSMTEKMHDELVSLYGTGKKVVRTRKNYASRDKAVNSRGTKFEGTRVGKTSDIFQTTWPNTEESRKGVFTKHRYENRIKASDLSIFNISVVTEEEADSLGLFDYPKNIDEYKCPVILGANIPDETQDLFRRLNAKFGPSNQLRLWILVFEDKPAITANYQENYWVRGNKNELVVCIGKKGEEIQWAHSFSWSLSGALTAETAQKVLDMYQYTVITDDNRRLPVALPIVTTSMKKSISEVTGIDTSMIPLALPLPVSKQNIKNTIKSKGPVFTTETLKEYYKYLDENLNRFERRSFEEFSYIKVDPKPWQIILIYVLALLISVGINLWATFNDINDKKRKYY